GGRTVRNPGPSDLRRVCRLCPPPSGDHRTLRPLPPSQCHTGSRRYATRGRFFTATRLGFLVHENHVIEKWLTKPGCHAPRSIAPCARCTKSETSPVGSGFFICIEPTLVSSTDSRDAHSEHACSTPPPIKKPAKCIMPVS